MCTGGGSIRGGCVPGDCEGLRARIAYREAAGWLAHARTWIHPRDLALRDAGLTGSYAVAAHAGRLDTELPTMAAAGSPPDVVPSDQIVGAALQLGPALAAACRASHLAPRC